MSYLTGTINGNDTVDEFCFDRVDDEVRASANGESILKHVD